MRRATLGRRAAGVWGLAALCGGLLSGSAAWSQVSGGDPKSPLSAMEAAKADHVAWERSRVQEAYRRVRGAVPPPLDPAMVQPNPFMEGGYDPRIVYGADDRRDVYQVTEPQLLAWQQAAAVVVSRSELTDLGNGTYQLSVVRWTTQSGAPVCADEPFREQYTIGFCSGFLVGPDLAGTAGHCVDTFNAGSTALVFGFDQLGPGTGLGSDPNIIVDADDVYFVSQVLASTEAGDDDYAVLRLDRPVVGRTPLPIRRSGDVAVGTPLVMIGHGVTLPKKIDAGGIVRETGNPGYFTANVDAYGGNSGSMVLNALTGEIEGILVRGNSDFTTAGGCTRSRVCPDTGCPTWEEISKAPRFAEFVPPLGLLVSPGAGTTHLGPVGGPFTPVSVAYTLGNTTQGVVGYEVSFVSNAAGLTLDDGSGAVSGPLSGTLPAGGSVTVTVALPAGIGSLAGGNYESVVNFRDTTSGRDNLRTHVVEIGSTGFTTGPSGGLSTGGPVGGPFNGTAAYTVTSTRPTPVTVRVSADQPWITINGVSGVAQDIVLGGEGSSSVVTVGIGPAALGLGNGVVTGTVTFQNATGGQGTTTRGVTLDVGRYTFVATDLPLPISDFVTTTSTLVVSENVCVADLDVELDIGHTFIGDLTVDLVSPAGTTVRLHNRTGGTTENIVRTYDQGVTNPDGPGTLSDVIGEPAAGTWRLVVRDEANADTGTINAWALKLAAGACPPSRTTVYENLMEVDPGWAAQGQWAYGRPTGIVAGSGRDPTAGFTGTNVCGYNLAGGYPNNMATTQWMTTSAINLAGVTGARLEFARWLGVERRIYDKADIQVSVDGGTTWTTIWSNPDVTINETAWSQQRIAVPMADGQSDVRFRWGLGPTDVSVVFQGWNIDDVRVTGFVSAGCPCPADYDGSGSNVPDLDDLLAFFRDFNEGDSTTSDGDPSADVDCTGEGSVVDVSDIVRFFEVFTAGCP